jgi:ribosomal protein S18 acetylase RimI-like enzyme
MTPTIRTASTADLDQLAPLFEGYRAFYERTPDGARARDYLQRRLEAADATVLLAEGEGVVVGFALLYPGWSSLNMAPILQLSDLYVDPTARARGAGRLLLDACEALGRERGVQRLQLETQRTNTVVQALYTELGWELEEDFITYTLPLDPPEQAA